MIADPNMTRFMMSLDDAVSLVTYAFSNAKQGDLFVQKAPAATIKDLAVALKELFKANNEIKIKVRKGGTGPDFSALFTSRSLSLSITFK